MNHDSVSEIKDILDKKGLALKKRWGQNFMINRGAREKIVSFLNPTQNEIIWEIGPGLGSMTELLIKSGCRLYCFEIDQGLIQNLKSKWGDNEKFNIIEGDVVKTWQSALEFGTPQGILGNLPYATSSKIISSIIENGQKIERMIFTVQKELAERMTAKPRNKNYSSFSVFCQFSYETEYKGDLKPGSFYPAPEVNSAIIKMTPKTNETNPINTDFFYKIVRTAFFARRKTLLNNLSKEIPGASLKEVFVKLNLSLQIRGEELSVKDFIVLSNELLQIKKDPSDSYPRK
ncbi:MAG: ribosomal RNA small subunit methyltransferase A [Spirochaetales bacterium]|nr:ribosomal RNA small subunit methyltransferase A [Spirochaetales bacterium]